MSERNGKWVLEVLSASGGLHREFELSKTELELGRKGRDLTFADDSQMADRHARLVASASGIEINDTGEGSGVWVRLRGSDGQRLELGDQIWLGAQILVVAREEGRWVLRHHGADGRQLGLFDLPETGVFIGRGSDLILDPSDRALSRRHAQIVFEQGHPRIYDRGAHNGTFLKLTATERLTDGSEFRIAAQHLRLVRKREAAQPAGARPAEPSGSRPSGLASRLRALDSARTRGDVIDLDGEITEPILSTQGGLEGDEASRGRPASVSAGSGTRRLDEAGRSSLREEPSQADEAHEGRGNAEGGLADRAEEVILGGPETVLLVIDSDQGSVTLEVEAGKTVLEAVQEAGLERGTLVDWECGDGGCGVCVLGVVEGARRMDPPDPESGEMKTIQITEQVVPDPNQYRLACQARVRGTVRLRKLT